MPTHKFHLGQPVEFNPPRGIYAPRAPYVVTAKLPDRDGAFEHRIRIASETHERLARENELSSVTRSASIPTPQRRTAETFRRLEDKPPARLAESSRKRRAK